MPETDRADPNHFQSNADLIQSSMTTPGCQGKSTKECAELKIQTGRLRRWKKLSALDHQLLRLCTDIEFEWNIGEVFIGNLDILQYIHQVPPVL